MVGMRAHSREPASVRQWHWDLLLRLPRRRGAEVLSVRRTFPRPRHLLAGWMKPEVAWHSHPVFPTIGQSGEQRCTHGSSATMRARSGSEQSASKLLDQVPSQLIHARLSRGSCKYFSLPFAFVAIVDARVPLSDRLLNVFSDVTLTSETGSWRKSCPPTAPLVQRPAW